VEIRASQFKKICYYIFMIFKYKAKKINGEEIKGEKEAKDEFELAKSLKDDGYILIYFDEKKRDSLLDFFSPFIGFLFTFGGVPTSEKMIFTRNLSVMIEAGISISRGIEAIAKQTSNKKFKKVLSDVAEEIKKGKAFNEVLAEHSDVFSVIFTAMIKAGEKSGKLHDSLKILSLQLKRDYDLKRRVRGAMIYPAIVVSAMIIIGILMMIYVVPTLVATFKEFGTDLPASTKFFIIISDFLANHGFISFILFLLFLSGILYLRKNEHTKKVFNFLALKTPIIKGLTQKINTARTARTLGSLVGSGVSVLEALEVTEEVLQNKYYKEIVRKAREHIQKGGQISKIFAARQDLFPPVMSEMTAVGEETGKISDMLIKVAVFYEGEVASQTKNLSTIIEPILMIVIGGVVLFFALAMLTPMYTMMGDI